MFTSFTGNSRRPRQVNLSGRNNNPFAAYPSGRQNPHGPGPQNTLAIAQQERLARQQERDRLGATRVVQRTWRGYRSRKTTHEMWRAEWDAIEDERTESLPLFDDPAKQQGRELQPAPPFGTASACLSQLRLLVQFFERRNSGDVARLVYFSDAFQKTLHEVPSLATEGEWTMLLKRLAEMTLRVLRSAGSSAVPAFAVPRLLQLLVFLTGLIPKPMARLAQGYYSTMAILTKNFATISDRSPLSKPDLIQTVLALLLPITSETLTAYEWFAKSYLTLPDLMETLGSLDILANNVNYKLLTSALEPLHIGSADGNQSSDGMDSRLWLLAYFIFFNRSALGDQITNHSPELGFVKVVSELLNSTALQITRRLEAEESADFDDDNNNKRAFLHPFIKDQLLSLVNPASITGLLSQLQPTHLSQGELADSNSDASKDAKDLANYALTLLRVFPRRGDDIRMWLYLGSAASSDRLGGSTSRIPAVKYFWHASRSSKLFAAISRDSTKVLPLLKPAGATSGPTDISQIDRDQEWTTILLFLELYTFVLKVMDDDEFFSSASSFTASSNARVTWTRESALSLKDVKELTVFLKNLAFTLYWNSADLTENETIPDGGAGLRSYFSSSTPQLDTIGSVRDIENKNKEKGLPGVTGIPLDYFKGLITGLLRMVHERDSRRKFLPERHWLMTDRFDMEGFIPAVVAEEENRHQLQDEDEEDPDDLMSDAYDEPSLGLVGTGFAQQARRIESLRRRQQQAARRKQLEAVAPRLEILKNMPFFIPFATRVQIFREFIYRDQLRRRHGFIDPDSWRMSVAQASMGALNGPPMTDILNRHHANIRRESLFDDAFDQFYELGDGLKEPIQITFIDKFNAPEAGIDGGGVTKEFLTSVTNEAFKSTVGLRLFEENDQHLLYPSPVAVEQRKENLRQLGLKENTSDWNEQVRDLLRRYEFLGRVIGKCLYEGILVDVGFAPFFLLKWALTGGMSSAQRETAYRANLNDLKDLDSELYQGLLQLKNHPGDVEDFSLNFTVTDTIPLPDGRSRTITRDLKSNGSDTTVTNQNRLVYISYIARYRLQIQPALQTNAFLQGLGQVIQPSWLSMFNQSELQTLVSGESGDIDVMDLRRNTLYGGVYTIGDDKEEHPTIKLFWEVMERMTNEERRKVLGFVTSTPRAPLLGFSHLHPRFSIRDSSEDQERLPSTSTCVNLLKLPRYKSANALREKLLYAVNSGAGFDLS